MRGWASLTKSATVVLSVVAVALALVLFSVKYRVQDLEEELARVTRQIDAERRAQHVLHAEWSYLTDPQRLRRLASRHLPDLRPITPEQLGTFADLPAADAEPEGLVRGDPAGRGGVVIPLVERVEQ